MRKLEGMAAYFFTCLGINFLVCSILVVPEDAFADHWIEPCQNACCDSCFPNEDCDKGSECYMNCVSPCLTCGADCNEDPGCIDGCVAQAKKRCDGDSVCRTQSCLYVEGCIDGTDYCKQVSKSTECPDCHCIPLMNVECVCRVIFK